MDFVHLHTHTHYSILDGAIKIPKLLSMAKEFGMNAVAMTDHGNMFGAIEFYQSCKKAGIKPIIGEEFYVAYDHNVKKAGDKRFHLVLLAKNKTGYQNLMKLSSIGYTEGFYYKPRIDYEVLEKYHEGLICLTACIAGEVPQAILKEDYQLACDIAQKYNNLFGKDHFYLELQDHGLPQQKIVNKALVKMSSELGIPLVATNDCHYPEKKDAINHDVLLCIQTKKLLTDETRMRFDTEEFYFKSPDEMNYLFAEVPDAITNTAKIAEMIDLELELDNPVLPIYEVPEGYNLETYLEHLVNEGAKDLYPEITPEIQERIDFELSVINDMGFPGYFLITWDFINYGRTHGVPIGPGRGSAAGSIVAYSLGITLIDPLKYDLLFERFLNPDRHEMPDIDIDFCSEKREIVYQYVIDKYGKNRVSQIITYNKLKSKQVIKDVARVMSIPFETANQISKMIPQNATLSDALNPKSNDFSEDFKKFYDESDSNRQLIDTGLALEELNKSTGRHAAGVVIAKSELTDFTPLFKDPKDGSIIAQYDKKAAEAAGLVKLDFLALNNLTIIDHCLKLIEHNYNKKIDINKIPVDDQKVFEIFGKGETDGIFQFESAGMKKYLKELQPNRFEDLVAMNALYRPGPLDYVPSYIARKLGKEEITYDHPIMEEFLKDTYGVTVYQEQVMLQSRKLAGFTRGEADSLRKAIAKKKQDMMAALKGKFAEGCLNNPEFTAGCKKGKKDPEQLVEKIWQDWEKFGSYAFNKSHSVCYAFVAYQTAFLKTYYRKEYMAALLTFNISNQEDVIQYIQESKSNNIKILPPDIRKSYFNFTTEDENIRFGLGALKGVGSKAIDSIVEARKKSKDFKSIKDFLENIDVSTVNKGVMESLTMAGAFDSLHKNRAQLFASTDNILKLAASLQKDKAMGQGNLFGAAVKSDSNNDIGLDLVQVPSWSDEVRLDNEHSVLGMYLSGHPLKKFEKEINAHAGDTSLSIHKKAKALDEGKQSLNVNIVGIVRDFSPRISQRGKHYALFKIEDMVGSIDAIIFERGLKKFRDIIETSSKEPLVFAGSVEVEDNQIRNLLVNDVQSIRTVRRATTKAVYLNIKRKSNSDLVLTNIKAIMEENFGRCPVYFKVIDKDNEERIIKAHNSLNIQPTEQCINKLISIVGKENISYNIS